MSPSSQKTHSLIGLFLSCLIFMVIVTTILPTPTMAKTSTKTPTPSLTPTRTALTFHLKRQLFFAGVGGAGGYCYGVGVHGDHPVLDYERVALLGFDVVCLYGFQVGEFVEVKIFDPANRLTAKIPVYIQDIPPFFETETYTVNTVELIPLSAQAPRGKWTIVAEGTLTNLKVTFENPDDSSDYTISKLVHPGTPWYDSRRTTRLMKQGETLLVEGVNYPPNQALPVAIYKLGESWQNSLITGQTVWTNSAGTFSAGFLISNQFTPGAYYVSLYPSTSGEFEYGVVSHEFRVVQPIQVCPSGKASYIQKNDTLQISSGPPNIVREKPGLKSKILGKLFEYERLDILAGPKCVDGMIWWKVKSINTGMDGWTAEGKDGDYWLIPVNFGKSY